MSAEPVDKGVPERKLWPVNVPLPGPPDEGIHDDHDPGFDPGAEWVLVDKLTVTVHKDGRVTIDVEFSTSDDRAGSFDGENPAEYDEEAKASWRSLLKHLGYRRGEKWSWERT